MDVSIILVNYKSTQLTLDCIESIYRETVKHSFEIILVDNDSKDDCKTIVLSKYPQVVFLQMDYNAGFARGNNAGIEISTGKYILLLNTDTIILDGAIDKSIDLLQSHPEAVGAGVQLLNSDGTTQISGAYFVKGGLNTLLQLPYLGRLIRNLGYRFKSQIPNIQTFHDTVEVDWVVGAYFLVKNDILKKSGLLDSDFFMYAEEMEWCGRLRKHGTILLFPEPKVIHLLGGSSINYYTTSDKVNGKNLWDKKGRQIIVSNMLRIRKQFGIGWFLLNLITHIIEIPLFFICLLIEKIFAQSKAQYKWKNLLDYTLNVTVAMSYFFKILLNKPFFYKVL